MLDMTMTKFLLCAIFQLSVLFLSIPVQAQNQAGFISIDCGSSESSYTDEKTGISYLSDSKFTESGESNGILASYKSKTDEQQFWNLRSFPKGSRNCYTLEPTGNIGTRYLIRARFMYGNYDNKDELPKFDLHIGVDFWDTVEIPSADSIVGKEIAYVSPSERVHVCLVDTSSGTPFISALELRPVDSSAYASQNGTSLLLYNRFDFGLKGNQSLRYKDDSYDRIWSSFDTNDWTPLNTSFKAENYSQNSFKLPFDVVRTAYTLNSLANMGIFWDRLNTTTGYFFFIHFAELAKLQPNQTREFNISMNNNLWFKPFVPGFSITTIHSAAGKLPDSDGKISIWFNYTGNATLPPLINALEVFRQQDTSGLESYKTDVEAILNIKTEYGITIQNWQGDPCVPKDYLWDGLNCSYRGFEPPRITSLDLSSKGLKGEISSYIAGLTMLEYLDLSNNSLSGTVPEFLANLEVLRVLNLKGNKLEGPLPPTLLERSRNGLSLSVDENVLGSTVTAPSPSNQNSSSARVSNAKNNFVVQMVVSLWTFASVRVVVLVCYDLAIC